MPAAVSIPILGALFVLAVIGMRLGWVHRTRRSATLLGALPDPEASLGSAVGPPVEASYVSTTRAGDWLDRVTVYGLGSKSQATAQVFTGGLRVERGSGPPLVLPTKAVRSIGWSSGMAGKFLGRDALVVIGWTVDDSVGAAFETGLLPRRRADGEAWVTMATGLLRGSAATKEIDA